MVELKVNGLAESGCYKLKQEFTLAMYKMRFLNISLASANAHS